MRAVFPAVCYDLAKTLNCGQAFRWRPVRGGWEGVVEGRWVRLVQAGDTLEVEAVQPGEDWDWLRRYLQLEIDFPAIVATFPRDIPMQLAEQACRGLRLLRQDPWECLASFILSSTKQIVQIQQIVETLCARFGEAVPVPQDHALAYSFPTAERLAACREEDLRACKMGFRAPYLRETAGIVARGESDLAGIGRLPLEQAREELITLPGVGRKIADCVLLFAYGFPTAFPVDVWILKALRGLYFPRRRPTPKQMHEFVSSYFGPWSGYAQQYLFHFMRTARPGTPAGGATPSLMNGLTHGRNLH
jgi:N-glycosylase/DNA lyase